MLLQDEASTAPNVKKLHKGINFELSPTLYNQRCSLIKYSHYSPTSTPYIPVTYLSSHPPIIWCP